MQPIDIAIVAVIALVIVAVLWLVTSSGRRTSGGDLFASWLAWSLVVFVVGGGLAMFGVAVVYILLGQDAGKAALVLLAISLVLEPFVVALALWRRGGRTRRR